MAAPEFPSTVFGKSPSWGGFGSLRFLVIFGASYADVGYEYAFCIPTRDEPLGVPFPGATYAEPGEPNWVGHLITNYAPGDAPLLVYNYAKGGAQVHNVANQVRVMYAAHIGAPERPEWAPWTSADTLFITWVGINDSAWSCDHTANLEKLFEAQLTLYETGARNFLYVNIPPIDRSPAKGRRENYIAWNTALKGAAERFAAAHTDATVMIYSSWDTFNALLDDPEAHGFPVGDVRRAGGAIWYDFLHPTSKVHDFVARDMAAFLSAQPAYVRATSKS
ncbi:hypothetical protein B0H15DRAFT_850115 [Mycena belliarum]|uniref:Carbohydrate esterase family 16 protein n=1 Tax=Mycena belliarum TaxID=1033014 RepID=A0AAD6U3M8_9AGAR|nr:hypothetical protein B0H15DRAFT_850115 [Mycena belliae]